MNKHTEVLASQAIEHVQDQRRLWADMQAAQAAQEELSTSGFAKEELSSVPPPNPPPAMAPENTTEALDEAEFLTPESAEATAAEPPETDAAQCRTLRDLFAAAKTSSAIAEDGEEAPALMRFLQVSVQYMRSARMKQGFAELNKTMRRETHWQNWTRHEMRSVVMQAGLNFSSRTSRLAAWFSACRKVSAEAQVSTCDDVITIIQQDVST